MLNRCSGSSRRSLLSPPPCTSPVSPPAHPSSPTHPPTHPARRRHRRVPPPERVLALLHLFNHPCSPRVQPPPPPHSPTPPCCAWHSVSPSSALPLVRPPCTGRCALFMLSPTAQNFVLHTPSMLMLTFFSSFGFLFACHCYKDQHPTNLYLLGGFTVSMAWSVGVVCAQYAANGMGMIVLQEFLLRSHVALFCRTSA